MPVFERLAQYLKHASRKFRKFIEKEYTIVRKRYLAGHRIGTTTDHSHRRHCVMRRSEGPSRHQSRAVAEFSGHRMYLGGFECLAKRKRGHNRWQTLGHHRFSRTGRPYKQYIVPTGTGHLEGALHILLSLDFVEIVVETTYRSSELRTGIDLDRCRHIATG